METSNAAIAKKLREVAAAYSLKGGHLFQIRAYENTASAIERSTSEIKDLWQDNNLDKLPGIGESLKEHLDELFKTGKVKHWESVKKGIPDEVFEFLEVPGIGPKTALKLVKLGVKDPEDLKKKLASGFLAKLGFSEKLGAKISTRLEKPSAKSGRMLLPYAFTQAEKILTYLRKNQAVIKADVLGSLRRMVVTIGDLDFAIASKDPKEVVEYLSKMPGIKQVVNQGETKATYILDSGLQADFLIIEPDSYGALLQHFTGSKAHNIHLRTLAEKKGLFLSEYGLKKVQSAKGKVQSQIIKCKTEDELYGLLKMQTPPPETREDNGEIEASLRHNLPKLIELKDIKGDLHLHSNLIIHSSHDVGANSLEQIAKKAQELGYHYIGISDHQPSISSHNKEQMVEAIKKRSKIIEQFNYSHKEVRVLNLLEVDIMPNGSLGMPDEALKLLDFALAGVHSSHHQSKEIMTKRILKALANPYIKVLTHPTNRILNQREGSEVDWEEIFKFAAKRNVALEINSFYDRLDLTDTLVKVAKSFGVKFVINTDAHEISQMNNMRFGVAVGRRGWAEEKDILNSWDFTKFAKWFKVS